MRDNSNRSSFLMQPDYNSEKVKNEEIIVRFLDSLSLSLKHWETRLFIIAIITEQNKHRTNR